MRSLARLFGPLVLLVASACSSAPANVGKDPGVDLSKYKTYQWVTQNEVAGLGLQEPKVDFVVGSTDVQTRSDLEPQIRDLIDRGLQRQGFRQTTDGKPDFYVT